MARVIILATPCRHGMSWSSVPCMDASQRRFSTLERRRTPADCTHKFTRATARGGAIPGVRSSDGWLLAHSRESAVALSIIIVHCRQTRGNIGKSAPVPFYPSTVIEISDGMLVRATCPRFKPSRELMTHLGGRGALLLRCPKGFWRLQEALATLVAANGVLLRFQTAQRFLAAPIVAELPLLTFPGTSWRHRELRRWGIPGETIADCGFRLPKGFRGGGAR